MRVLDRNELEAVVGGTSPSNLAPVPGYPPHSANPPPPESVPLSSVP